MSNKVPNNSVSFHYSFYVKPEDIDELKHVNNVVYLKWVNEISGKHWGILSTKEINKKYFWVVLRHEIDYLQSAILSDKITVYTWVGESKGVKSIRYVHIYKGDTLLVKAQTTWCLVGSKSLRPSRINQEILNVLEK